MDLNLNKYSFEKDKNTGALLNNNRLALKQFKERREIQQKISSLEQLCQEMKKDITELQKNIKNILN